MYLLDTDHLSILQRGGGEAQRLQGHLARVSIEQVAASVISYEEQTRGWLAYTAKARSLDAQVEAYRRLRKHMETFCAIPLLDFGNQAVSEFQVLHKLRLRIGTMDQKIAAIALANNATLLTRNLSHFGQVPGLDVEDWTR